jgi:D-amino-acid oxidase
MKQNKITIIGCGVSGLTVAVVLQEAGYDVEIITEQLPHQTTSIKAGAIWLPYAIEPKDLANKWSFESYGKLEKLSSIPSSGVSMVDLTVLIDNEAAAWWKDSIPKDRIRRATADEMPNGYHFAYVLNVPLVETPKYLDYLMAVFKSNGGQIIIQKITSMEALAEEKDWVVNCTGLGARELLNDDSMYPIRGQIVKAKAQLNINCIADETEGKEPTYIFPRKDALILGGTALKGNESIEPDAKTTQAIIERCQSIEPNLTELEIETVYVGLRPGRPSIRLERQNNIIHNYGHGGAGFTVAWGCAWAVRALLF